MSENTSPPAATPETASPPARKKTRIFLDTEEAGPILFRIPSLKDLWTVYGRIPNLPTERGAAKALEAAAADDRIPSEEDRLAFMSQSLEALELADSVLLQVALKPRLVSDSPIEFDPLEIFPVEEIDATRRILLFQELLELAGFSLETAEGVRPFSPTETGSSSSTDSPRDTEDAPPDTSREPGSS